MSLLSRRKDVFHCVSNTVFLAHIRKYFHFLGGAPFIPSLMEAVNSELSLSSASTQRAATPHF